MRGKPASRSVSVDQLVASAWLALDAEQGALSRSGGLLGAADVAQRSERLAADRRQLAATLRDIARSRHERSSLLEWFAAGTLSRAMLGLPEAAQACVFDLDGVLTTSAEVHAEAWAEALDPILLHYSRHDPRGFVPFDPQRDYEAFLAGRPRLPAARSFLASRGIVLPEGSPGDPPSAATLHGLANGKQAALTRRMRAGSVRTFEGSLGYLEAARVLGLGRAVVSASANANEMLRLAGLDDLVDVRIDASTLERDYLAPLPAPDTLLAACRALGVAPAQAVAFETTVVGLEAARQAGMELTVGVARNGGARSLRLARPDVLVTDLRQLVRG
jgi:beta-phosphoglucomutase-like phosphatase (HAD superfamily)